MDYLAQEILVLLNLFSLMQPTFEDVEQRIEFLINIHKKIEEFFKLIPEIPFNLKQIILDRLLNNDEMKKLIEDLKERRAPRILIVGKTGSGKSSLINAIFGRYVSEISDVEAGTKEGKHFQHKIFGKTVFEVIDSRGLAESFGENDNAFTSLKSTIQKFDPDAFMFVNRAKDRGHLDTDMEELLKAIEVVNEELEIGGNKSIPLIIVNNQVDELEPTREKDPKKYNQRKLENILESEEQIKNLFRTKNIQYTSLISTSSLIEWDCEDPTKISKEEQSKLSISFDGRYNIDSLIDTLVNNMDFKAGVFFMMYVRVNKLFKDLSNMLTKIFATVSGGIGLTPLPLSDIFFLSTLQVLLVMIIGYFAGRKFTINEAKEFLSALGLTSGAGFVLRSIAQQLSKLLNIFPGAGSAISGGIAYWGTFAIGKVSISYFFDNEVSTDTLKGIIKKYTSKKEPVDSENIDS